MHLVGRGNQPQPMPTEMQALPGLCRDRLQTAHSMQFIQPTSHRPSLETEERRQLLIRQQWVCQQQAQDAPLASSQAQAQQGRHLLFLQAILNMCSPSREASYQQTSETG